jgi:hypothetical protein
MLENAKQTTKTKIMSVAKLPHYTQSLLCYRITGVPGLTRDPSAGLRLRGGTILNSSLYVRKNP